MPIILFPSIKEAPVKYYPGKFEIILSSSHVRTPLVLSTTTSDTKGWGRNNNVTGNNGLSAIVVLKYTPLIIKVSQSSLIKAARRSTRNKRRLVHIRGPSYGNSE